MGEENADMAHWGEGWSKDEPAMHEAAELVAMFEKAWYVISSALDRWTSADLERLTQRGVGGDEALQTFPLGCVR